MLEKLAKLCAILAGAILVFMTALTCVSILGRETLGKTVPGDFELVGLAAGGVVGLFMPLCQIQRGNIIVDFFTTRCPRKVNAGLDRLGALLLALTFALLSWRAALGGLSAYDNHSSSMLLGVPEWLAYAPMVPGFALTAIIGMHQAFRGFGEQADSHGETT